MSMVYISNSMENLCLKLAGSVAGNDKGVFSRNVIVTQTAGMNAWLKREIAGINGCFANFTFMNQDGIFNALYELLTGTKIENRVDFLKYSIYELLNEDEFKRYFSTISDYYKESDLRRFHLAGKIADLFDQYQIYRSDMISNWRKDRLSTKNQAEEWQKWLWNRVETVSREEIKTELMKLLVPGNREIIEKAFPKISFFGISVYTGFHMEIFRKLAECTTVDFYAVLASVDIEQNNPLLHSLGNKLKELTKMFPGHVPEKIPADKSTLLGKIQDQILKNANDLEITNEMLLDGSVQVNSCYTPAREAETLYNYLLDLFVKDSTLHTQDILVMVPDISKYAPYIKAVFRNAPVKIPFEVSGAASAADDSIISALEQILLFDMEDFTSEKVVGLLEQKRIKEKFGLDDCVNIRGSVNKAGIRFGWENKDEDESAFVSWKQGLDKILLGHAMLTDKEFEKSYPFQDSESTRSADLLRLRSFAEKLHSLSEQTDRDCKSMSDWRKWLFEDVIDRFIYRDDFSKKDREEMNSIYRALNFIDRLDDSKNYPFKVFLDELKNRLFPEIRESSLNTGRVTFSSPVPVRGLPFRVIGFMGLDNGVFPARDSFAGFDLLGDKYMEGDRSRKETDKSIFLETILSARDRIYLSFTGQSPKDNSEIPPSIVLDELLDYLEQHCPDRNTSKLVRKGVLVRHPLHGFSKRYGKADSRMFTYLYNSSEEENTTDPGKQITKDPLTEITVDSLLKFFEHPVVWYFNKILKIYYEEDDVSLPESEMFIPDSLQEWMIKNEILKIDNDDIKKYVLKNKKESQLPLVNLGDYHVKKFMEEIACLKEKLRKEIKGRTEDPVNIDMIIGNYRIRGIIAGVYGAEKELIGFSTSGNSLKYKTLAFLKTLILSCDKRISSSVFFTKGGGKCSFPVSDPVQAQSHLLRLLQYYSDGCEAPLIFTLEAGKASKKENATPEDILECLISETEDDEYSSGKSVPYMKRLCADGFFESLDAAQLINISELADLLNI